MANQMEQMIQEATVRVIEDGSKNADVGDKLLAGIGYLADKIDRPRIHFLNGSTKSLSVAFVSGLGSAAGIGAAILKAFGVI